MEYISILSERERLAEDILTNKQLIVDYDRTRNTNREALNNLKKESLNSQKKVWVNLGEFFIKLEKDNVKSYIEKDQKNLEKEISSLRDTIKQKTTDLEKLETGEINQMKGFELQGITAKDLYNITGVNKEFDG
ncbi:215_t:CDS:2 [Funneliformis geosporum]|uniref:p53 and DNA damage-regulated protein 1 n=1 Tax=Funneliformis geosporum TaxID=1117311 RepID=A0A9W4SQV7_9GLOM|nr:215_t:CDS:2 [Funneliformis geosporum]CAI2177980.1 15987_t:CDS:2 [Funneliformis geosporum]